MSRLLHTWGMESRNRTNWPVIKGKYQLTQHVTLSLRTFSMSFCGISKVSEWVSEWVWCSTRRIMGHFRNESFQPITWKSRKVTEFRICLFAAWKFMEFEAFRVKLVEFEVLVVNIRRYRNCCYILCSATLRHFYMPCKWYISQWIIRKHKSCIILSAVEQW